MEYGGAQTGTSMMAGNPEVFIAKSEEKLGTQSSETKVDNGQEEHHSNDKHWTWKNYLNQNSMLAQNKMTNFSQFIPNIGAMFWGSFPLVKERGAFYMNLICLWEGLYAITTVVVVVARTSSSFHSISYER